LNQNAETGVARTLCRLREGQKHAVIEMGMRAAGEINDLCRHVLPDAGVITHVTPCHLDKLKTLTAVAESKGELNKFLGEESRPCLVYEGSAGLELIESMNPEGTILYGASSDCPVRLLSQENVSLTEQSFTVAFDEISLGKAFPSWRSPEENPRFQLGFAGRFQAFNALPAITLGFASGLSREQIQQGLDSVQPPGMRAKVRKHESGSVFYLDCYNASPASMKAALNLVAKTDGFERRIAVLGDMLELGDDALSYHTEAGGQVADLGFDKLFIYGELSKATAEAATAGGMKKVKMFDDHAELNQAIRECLGPSTLVIVKGSNGMQLWKALDGLGID
jgi:UDP-N-acetylmuramoyl-tripeptide--D-alanyl-D-alanine ligase